MDTIVAAPILSSLTALFSPQRLSSQAIEASETNMAVNDSGLSAGSTITGTRAIIITSFLAVAMYNFIELNFIILTTFKKRSGLYFWSFIIATWGIPLYIIGFLLKNFQLTKNSYLYVTLIVVGGWPMVTGQSVVLYSRLHLILRERAWLRAVLAMIIVDAIICYIPSTVLIYGANSSNPEPFLTPYSIYEKVQVTIFFLQEITISGLYILQTINFLRITAITAFDANRNMLRHLLIVSVIVAILDTGILSFEYAKLYSLQTAFKALAYSMKLKLEFSILNRLASRSLDRVSRMPRLDSDRGESICSGGSAALLEVRMAAGGDLPSGLRSVVESNSRAGAGATVEATTRQSLEGVRG